MTDIKALARSVLVRQKRDFDNSDIDAMVDELKRCQKGRKVQVLIALEKVRHLTHLELRNAMFLKSDNLCLYANRLIRNKLIEKYDETKFKSPEEVNLVPHYYAITDLGLELIRDLGD